MFWKVTASNSSEAWDTWWLLWGPQMDRLRYKCLRRPVMWNPAVFTQYSNCKMQRSLHDAVFFYCCCFCLFIFGYQRTCTWPAGTCVIELNPWPPWFCLKLILPRWLEMISGHFLWNLWFEVPVNHVCFLVSMAGDTYGYFLLLLALCGIVADPWLPET